MKKNGINAPGGSMHRYHFIFEGRVQGVGFRYSLHRIATQLGLTGWVKNQYDATVEAELQGEQNLINQCITALQNKRPIHIVSYSSRKIPIIEEETQFQIHY